jgi:hypothetical protein
MPTPTRVSYIKPDHEQVLVSQLEQAKHELSSWAQDVLEETGLQMSVYRMTQFIAFVLLEYVLGMVPGTLYSMLESPYFSQVRAWIVGLDIDVPGGSTIYTRRAAILDCCKDELITLAAKIQDAMQQEIGTAARDAFSSIMSSKREHVVANAECFIGIIVPSELLADKSVFERGTLITYLNARIYMGAKKCTSVEEFIGELKTPVMDGERYYFTLAGTVGFYIRPPGKNEIRLRFHQVDQYLSKYNKQITVALAQAGVLDMTVVSIDTTNIPVDKSDKTGSIGTGSRGTFFGHKLSVPSDANCIPIEGEMHDGRKADVTTFDNSFDVVKKMAKETRQDTWAVDLDAAYSVPDIVDKIETANAIPFININPKNSSRLQALARAASALEDVSRKAFNALPPETRKSWQTEVKAISESRNGPVPLDEKKSLLSCILHKLAAQARRKGLNSTEQGQERQLRKEVMDARREIRVHGTPFEQKVGLTTAPLGTTEWMLVYATRGQNEGINSILKKRGDVIGDCQHSSWLHGHDALEPRCKATFASIKIAAFVMKEITGAIRHCLSRVHNWRKPKNVFCILILMIHCR